MEPHGKSKQTEKSVLLQGLKRGKVIEQMLSPNIVVADDFQNNIPQTQTSAGNSTRRERLEWKPKAHTEGPSQKRSTTLRELYIWAMNLVFTVTLEKSPLLWSEEGKRTTLKCVRAFTA